MEGRRRFGLGAIALGLFIINGSTPDNPSGATSVVAVEDDSPSAVAYSGPTSDESWGPSAGRSLDGTGEIFWRTMDVGAWVEADIGGTIYRQYPSDGFIWIPFAGVGPTEPITFTGFGSHGERIFTHEVPPIPCDVPEIDCG